MKNKFYVVFILVLTLIACNKDNIDQISPDHSELIKSKNGILIFTDQNHLNQTLSQVLQMSPNDRDTWEKKYKFKSAQSIFEDVVLANSEIDAYYESLPEEELDAIDLGTVPEYSELYYKYLNAGVIIDDNSNNEEDTYRLNLADQSFAPICNVNGMFMVGDTLYNIAPNKIKYWINGDVNNPTKLIGTSEETDEIKFIVRAPKLKGSIDNGDDLIMTYQDFNKRRIKFETWKFETWQHLGDGTVWQYKYDIRVVSRKKNWLGSWKYNNTDIHFKGKWNGEIKYYDPINLGARWHYFSGHYPSNYPNYFNVNYSNVQVAVGVSGSQTGTYGSTWNISMTNDAQIGDVSIYDIDWIAYGHEWTHVATVKSK